MSVKIVNVTKERADEVFRTTNAVLKASISGDQKTYAKAMKDWEKILKKG